MYPNGVYIAVHLSGDTEKYIKDYISNNIEGLELEDDLHVTIIFSKNPHEKKINRKLFRGEGKFKRFSKFGDYNNSLVIELESDDLKGFNKMLIDKHGFTSDYNEYKPHITLSNNGGDIDIDKLPNIDFPFKFKHDFIENLDCDCDNNDYGIIIK